MARKRLKCYLKKDVEKFRQQGRELALLLYERERIIQNLLCRATPVLYKNTHYVPCPWSIPAQVGYASNTKED